MPARLTLICHAATEAVRHGRVPADEDLDSAGLAASARFSGPKARRWLSAPERRARRTAHLLAGRDADIEPALRDWDLGAWTGQSLAEVAATDPAAVAHWLSDPAACPHGGESLDAVLVRVAGFLTQVAVQGGRVAVVTHPAVVRAMIVTALDAGATAFWHLDAAPLTRADLAHDGRRWTVRALVPDRSRPAPSVDGLSLATQL